ncbi:MAG: hypothetical protein PVF45_12210 [Anaerolineae bacterium]|jgi:hypothetical protein
MKQLLVLLTLVSLLLVACGDDSIPTSKPVASVTPVAPETYNIGEPISFSIDDTVSICEDALPYTIVQITGSRERQVMLAHSCLGIAGVGVDRYCEDGQIKTVEVVFCSDVMMCEDVRVDATFMWDQREYVEVSEECAGETIHREIKQQVPAGKYVVKSRFLQDGQVVSKVLQEFTIAED